MQPGQPSAGNAQPGGGPMFRRDDGRGSISLTVDHGILWVLVENEPAGDTFVQCFHDALEIGLITTSMPTLVDARPVRGTVDWKAMETLSRLAPWGTGGSPIAYVSEDRFFSLLTRAVAALFPASRHRPFVHVEGALAWLRDASDAAASAPR
jgi:hypothetical protein